MDLHGGRDWVKMKDVKRASWVEKPARVEVGEGAGGLGQELAIHVEGAGGPLVGKGLQPRVGESVRD